ncbi:MAG: Gfo/Idh/MocA family oxidoreductase [Ilumatobacter sp.]
MSDRTHDQETMHGADALRVGLLGVAHLPHALSYARCLAASANADLVGVYDNVADLAVTVASRFDTPVHSELSSLLDLQLDAVVVCSATDGHLDIVAQAAQQGLHVLCEKPIATTVDDAQTMIDACAATGVQLHAAFVCRFYPFISQVRNAIQSGSIGQVVGMVGGNRGRPPLPPQYPDWITDRTRAGGGALIDHSVHVTDIMRFVSGQEAVRVNAEVDDRFWHAGVDDMAALSVVFDGGAIASIDPSWSVPPDHPWDYDFFLQVLGTEGSLWVDDTTESIQLVSSEGGPGMRRVPFTADIDGLMIEAFLASVRTGELIEPCASGLDGLRALEIALAGYEAAALCESVTLTPTQRP